MNDLAAIRKRCDKATPGPWRGFGPIVGLRRGSKHFTKGVHPTLFRANSSDCDLGYHLPLRDQEANSVFVANARKDVPSLCDEVEQLRFLVRELALLAQRHDPHNEGAELYALARAALTPPSPSPATPPAQTTPEPLG